MVLIAEIEHVELVRLAELRHDLRQQRHRFQAGVERVVSDLEQIASEGQMARLRDEAVGMAREQVDATRSAYRRANLQVATATMGVSVAPPALAATTASLLGTGIFAPIGIAAALGLSTAMAYFAWRDRAEQRRTAQWSYVFELRRALR